MSLIERLLVPRHRNYERRELDYSSEYGDPDGIEASEGSGDAARVQVNFDNSGTKWLVMAYANLEKL